MAVISRRHWASQRIVRGVNADRAITFQVRLQSGSEAGGYLHVRSSTMPSERVVSPASSSSTAR